MVRPDRALAPERRGFQDPLVVLLWVEAKVPVVGVNQRA
jgi:hypothetical protein